MLVLFLREKRIEKKSNNAESETIPERETIPEQKKTRPVLKDKREGGVSSVGRALDPMLLIPNPTEDLLVG